MYVVAENEEIRFIKSDNIVIPENYELVKLNNGNKVIFKTNRAKIKKFKEKYKNCLDGSTNDLVSNENRLDTVDKDLVSENDDSNIIKNTLADNKNTDLDPIENFLKEQLGSNITPLLPPKDIRKDLEAIKVIKENEENLKINHTRAQIEKLKKINIILNKKVKILRSCFV